MSTEGNRLECAVWEFTLGCNLRCTHCGSAAGIPRKDELDTLECFGLCEQLADLGCKDVSLMGGEPFLRDDWYSVGECVNNLGMNLNFVTNGIMIDKVIKRLTELKPKVVGISLDGMEDAHDSIRGRGTWSKALHAIAALRAEGIQVTVITTLSKINYLDLPKMATLLHKKEANWQIQTAMPFGNFTKAQMLSKHEFYATALFIAKQRIHNRFADLPVIGAHCYGYYSRVLPGGHWKGCTAGKTSIGITSDGSIVGCLSMGNDRFIEGNVRTRKLKDIWKDPKSFAYNRDFDESKLGPHCKGCRYGYKCKGGCNSVSYSVTGRLHNNPYCFHAIEARRA